MSRNLNIQYWTKGNFMGHILDFYNFWRFHFKFTWDKYFYELRYGEGSYSEYIRRNMEFIGCCYVLGSRLYDLEKVHE